MIVCGSQPQKTLPTLAAQISDRDNAVRSAALNTMVTIYANVGEAVYKYTSQVSWESERRRRRKERRGGGKKSGGEREEEEKRGIKGGKKEEKKKGEGERE